MMFFLILPKNICLFSSAVEQLFRKQQVAGSNPVRGSDTVVIK